MANSCIEHTGRVAFVRDADLVLALRLVEASRAVGTDDFAFPEDWRDELENLVPGGIDLDLDRHLAAPGARDAFAEALRATRADLVARGATLPAAEVDHLMGGASGRLPTPEVATAGVIATLARLLEVIGAEPVEAEEDLAQAG